MTSQYFDNPNSTYSQYHGQMNSLAVECGRYAFTTTGTTVEVPTYMSTIVACILTPYSTSSLASTFNETLYCDLTVTSMCVTVSRVAGTTYREFHFPIDTDQIANYDLETCPLMIAQAAMTLTSVEFYKGAAFAGTVTFDLEKAGGTNTYLAGKTVTNTAGTTDTYTSFSSGTSAVADGEVIQANTNGGSSSSVGDLAISIAATETAASYTSGLAFNYILFGFH